MGSREHAREPVAGRRSWMPQSLASRMFLLYGATLVLASVLVLGVLVYQQFVQHIEANTRVVEGLADVSAQPITESSVIGDFDTIRRLLDRMVTASPLREAVYTDQAGGRIVARDRTVARAPAWLNALVASRMPDLRREIAMSYAVTTTLRIGAPASPRTRHGRACPGHPRLALLFAEGAA